MLKDGIYGLAYAAEGERMPTEGSALATLRKGRIFGSDPWGGVFTGSCQFDADWRLNRVQLRLEVPPDGQLITGFSAGPGAPASISRERSKAQHRGSRPSSRWRGGRYELSSPTSGRCRRDAGSAIERA